MTHHLAFRDRRTIRGILFLFVFASLFSCASHPGRVGSIAGEPEPGASDPAAPVAEGLEVGVARLDISPDRPVILGGYGIYFLSRKTCRWSEGVHDPIYSTALFFLSGEDALLLVSLDLVGLASPDINDIRSGIARRTGLDPERVYVSTNHTHAGPDTFGLWGTFLPPSTGRDEAYMAWMKAQAVESGVRAVEGRKPARLFYAVGELSGLQRNIREDTVPGTPLDPTMTVLKAVGADGAAIATLTNWACHPTTEDEKNRLVSADWVGAFYQRMAERTDGVAMYVNGAIGAAIQPSDRWRDQNLRSPAQGFVWADAMGRRVADRAIELLAKAEELPVDKIDAASRPVEAAMVNRVYALGASLGLMPFPVPRLGEPLRTTVAAAHLGPLAIGTVPGEIGPDLGFEVRAALGGKAQILIGLGQDELGYIIRPEQYRDKRYSYEKMLCVGPDLGPAVVAAHRDMAASLVGRAGDPGLDYAEAACY